MTGSRRSDSLAALGRLVRFVARRDRVRLPVWIVSIGALIVVSAASLPPLYPDRESQELYVSIATGNPALQAFGGPGYGFDNPNIGVILVNETQLWGAVCVALMAIFLVTRHTRAEEDDERAEVIRSSVVGRHTPLAATVLVVGAAVVAIGLICGVGFIALGYATTGSLSLAASFVAAGLLFVGVAAVAAQVAGSARATLGYSVAALAAMFVVRAVGDAGRTWLRWLSPLGWVQSGRAFAGERWWPLVLCLATAVALVVLAQWLSVHRDLGSGLVTPHGGRASARRWLTHPVGLAVRLQRGVLAGWIFGMLLFGGLYGSIGDEIATFIEDNPIYADLVAQLQGVDITDSFFATALVMLALFASGFAVSAALRLRSEEHAGRADVVLAAPISRTRWAASYLVVDVVGTTLIVLAGGLGIGVGYALAIGDTQQVLRMLGASLVTVPGVLVLAGVAVALFGFVPRVALAAWAALAAVFVVAFFGEVLRLPPWVRAVSPFDHLPAVPAEDLRWAPVVTLLAVATALTGAGLWGLRRRDVHVT